MSTESPIVFQRNKTGKEHPKKHNLEPCTMNLEPNTWARKGPDRDPEALEVSSGVKLSKNPYQKPINNNKAVPVVQPGGLLEFESLWLGQGATPVANANGGSSSSLL